MHLTILLIFSIVAICNGEYNNFRRNYTNCQVVSLDPVIELHWNLVGSTIQIGMYGEARYYSVGFSSDGSMTNAGKGADAWVVSYSTSSTALCFNGCALDVKMPEEDQPIIDTTNNLLNQAFKRETNGAIVAEFNRAANTGDNADQIISLTAVNPMIWAAHPFSAVASDGEIPFHRSGATKWEGSLAIDFSKPASCSAAPGGNSFSAGGFSVSWIVGPDYIDFDMSATTTGYLSLGISTGPRMSNADCYTGWVVGGTTTLLDTWSPDYNQPQQDTARGGKSDVTNVVGTESGGQTRIQFRRLLNTGDSNDVVISNTPLYLLYAYAPTDGDANRNYAKHTVTGRVQVNFLNGGVGGGGGGNGPSPVIPEPPPTGPTFVSASGDFTVTWEINNVDGTIHFTMKAQTTGWLSIGFGDRPSMKGADYIVGSVDSGNQVTILDTWSTVDAIPDDDSFGGGKNDIVAVTGFEQTSTTTTISFKRKLDTGDTNNDVAITNKNLYLMWAYAPSDIRTDGSYDKHTVYGSVSVNFFTGGISSNFMTPSLLFAILIIGSSLIFISIRAIKSFHKNHLRASLKSGKYEVELESSAPLEVATPETLPMGQGYYKGSQFEHNPKSKQDKDDQEYYGGKKVLVAEGHQYVNEKNKIELVKSNGTEIKNKIWAVLQKRVPYIDATLLSVLIAVVWIVLNGASVFIFDISLLAKSFGHLIAVNAMFLTIPATRNSVIVWFMGVPFDKAIMFHRWLGYWTILLTQVHTFYTIAEWAIGGLSFTEQIKEASNLFGVGAWLSSIIIFATSFEIVRRRQFEVFYILHFFLLAFFVLGCLHNSVFWPYAGVAAALYFLDRLIRIFWGIFPTKTLALTIKGEKDKVVQVRFKKHWFGRLAKVYKPGQYVFLNFPGVNFFEWHPFSVSSGPHETTGEVHIKGLGNYTQKLLSIAEEKSQLWVRVDGPYGNLNMNYKRYPVLVLVSGGIGITPCVGMLRNIFRTGELESNYKPKPNCIEKVFFVWVVQSTDQYSWFAHELNECYTNSGQKGMPQLEILVYVTRDQVSQSGFIVGRPNIPELFGKVAKEFPKKASSVFVCGPKAMVDGCWDGANMLKETGSKCHFHHETFEF